MNFESPKCKGQVFLDKKTKIFTVKGTCTGTKLRYLAAAPPDFRDSYAGSALPFPNEEIAYDTTPNKNHLQISDGKFEFRLSYPNSYYINGGSKLIKPHVTIVVDDSDVINVQLGEPLVPNRSLTHLPGRPRRSVGSSHGGSGGR